MACGKQENLFNHLVGTRRDDERHLLEGCGIMTPAIAALGREAVQMSDPDYRNL
jgi:hypothetical protein